MGGGGGGGDEEAEPEVGGGIEGDVGGGDGDAVGEGGGDGGGVFWVEEGEEAAVDCVVGTAAGVDGEGVGGY